MIAKIKFLTLFVCLISLSHTSLAQQAKVTFFSEADTLFKLTVNDILFQTDEDTTVSFYTSPNKSVTVKIDFKNPAFESFTQKVYVHATASFFRLKHTGEGLFEIVPTTFFNYEADNTEEEYEEIIFEEEVVAIPQPTEITEKPLDCDLLDFDKLIAFEEVLMEERFSEDKLKLVWKTLNKHCYYTGSVKQILTHFRFEGDKIEIIKQSLDNLLDIENVQDLFAVLKFTASKTELIEYIEARER